MEITPPDLRAKQPGKAPPAAKPGGVTRTVLGWEFRAPEGEPLTPKNAPGYWTLHMAEMSKAVYGSGAEVVLRAMVQAGGFANVRWFDSGSTQAVGYLHEGHACLVFRGTQQTEDWLVDANIVMVGSPGRHLGFQSAWELVEPEVMMWLGQVRMTLYPRETLFGLMGLGEIPMVLGGHSLGGALAVLAASELAPYCKVAAVRTFGAPRVGSPGFARTYRKILGEVTIQLKHDDDVVPIVPPPVLYRHVVHPWPVAGKQRGMFEVPERLSVAAAIAQYLNWTDMPLQTIYKEPVTAMVIAVLFFVAFFTGAVNRAIPGVHHAVMWAVRTRAGYAVLFALAVAGVQQLSYVLPWRMPMALRWLLAMLLALGLAEAHVGTLLVAQTFVWTMVAGVALLRALMPSATDHFMDKYLQALERPYLRDAFSIAINPNQALYAWLGLEVGDDGSAGAGTAASGVLAPAVSPTIRVSDENREGAATSADHASGGAELGAG